MKTIDFDHADIFAHAADDTASPASLPFNPEDYRAEIDAFDITEAQKQEFLWTLWSIMRSFVELGFTTDICAAFAPDGRVVDGQDHTIPSGDKLD